MIFKTLLLIVSGCRPASTAAAASVRSLADEDDEVDSDSNDETARVDVNDVADSSVSTNLLYKASYFLLSVIFYLYPANNDFAIPSPIQG